MDFGIIAALAVLAGAWIRQEQRLRRMERQLKEQQRAAAEARQRQEEEREARRLREQDSQRAERLFREGLQNILNYGVM